MVSSTQEAFKECVRLHVSPNRKEGTFHKKANLSIEQIGLHIQWLFRMFFSVYKVHET